MSDNAERNGSTIWRVRPGACPGKNLEHHRIRIAQVKSSL